MAQRRTATEEYEQPSLSLTGTESGAALQRLAAEKLAAHRLRRLSLQPQAVAEERPSVAAPDEAAARVREAVAERYRTTQSYREFLEANACAEEETSLVEAFSRENDAVREQHIAFAEDADDVVSSVKTFGTANVKLPPQIANAALVAPEFRVRVQEPVSVAVQAGAQNKGPVEAGSAEELAELEEEIEFRFAPELHEHHIEALPLQANIIEFPRKIVAPRKARPRLAEGPLRNVNEEILHTQASEIEAGPPQLRIFEVEPEFIGTEPSRVEDAAQMEQPAWQRGESADAAVATHNAEVKVLAQELPALKSVATLELRLMAACVDAFWVGLGFVAGATATGYFAGTALLRLPHWELGTGAATAYILLAIGYALVCFTFSEATPGMTYAEIGLCTFEDENPTRAAMRKRLLATLLAAAPMGLGLLWAAMDSERLAWNDRLSRMYLRSY